MTITKKEAEELYKQKLISKDEFDEMYNDYLNENGQVNIIGIKYNASKVLKEVDPIAYKVYKDDYANYLIQDGYVIEEYFDFDDYLQYLKENGYTVIEDNELDEFEDNEFLEEQQETKEKTKQHLKHTCPKLK